MKLVARNACFAAKRFFQKLKKGQEMAKWRTICFLTNHQVATFIILYQRELFLVTILSPFSSKYFFEP